MTKEEKEALVLQRASAKRRCREVYGTITALKHILTIYYSDYYRWLNRFEKADRALAMEEKLTKVSVGSKRKEEKLAVKLTKQQILAIADELGVKVELNFDEE